MEKDKQCEQINKFSSVRHLSRVWRRNLELGFFCYLSCISLTRHSLFIYGFTTIDRELALEEQERHAMGY
jgi:hypothetical protein